MGALNLPVSGAVYVDANCIIYAVEKIAPYDAALTPLWQAAASGQVSVISSELIELEALVKPLRKNARLEAAFRAFLFDSAEFRVAPVELRIIEHAALRRQRESAVLLHDHRARLAPRADRCALRRSDSR